MQYFNRHNSEVDFIKDILRANYIPTIRFFNTETNIQPKFKTSEIIEGQTKNLISDEENHIYYENENIILNETIQSCKNVNNKITPRYSNKYEFGNWYPNITTNFISNKNYYDTDTHEYLGRYLRAYRDFYRIDVMNFYNCFSNRFISSYDLPISAYIAPYKSGIKNMEKDKNGIQIWTDNDWVSQGMRRSDVSEEYKIAAFPILFDTEYQIKFYTQTIGTVEYQAVWFNGQTPLGAVEVNPIEEDKKITSLTPITYTHSLNSTFTICIGSANIKEYKYVDSSQTSTIEQININTSTKNALMKQSLLYLFIKFPSSIDEPIVVLEQPKFTYAINNELLELNNSEKEQVAFSDTLLEYLSGSVISPADKIHKNTHRIQHKLLQNNFFNIYGVGGPSYVGVDIPGYKFAPGIFDEGVHQIIYKAFFDAGIAKDQNGTPVADGTAGAQYPKGYNKIPNFIGYVDKNVEELIMRVKDDDEIVQGGNK